jgi:hypothetical protein
MAGCAGDGGNDGSSATGPTFDDLDLAPTATTGILRGIVVDDAIRPVAGATITLQGDDPREATSTEAGTFGFDSLAPGPYFLTVSKPGFLAAQASAEVVAGVAEPPVVKVLLGIDAANQPYVEAYVFSGFIECMTPNVALCGLINDLVAIGTGTENVTQDNSQVVYPLSKVPTWVQTEMVWQSTQAAGSEMSVMYSYFYGCDDPTFYCDHEASGPSPLLLVANQTVIETIGLGTEEDVYIRTFTEAIPGTRQCSPVELPEVGQPCTGPAGLTFEQGFEYYTHIFYGYQPAEGWRFSSGEPAPQPSQ